MYLPTPNGKNDDVLQQMLKESTFRFLTEFRTGATDFSNISAIFARILHTLPEPPLEVIWFYSALNFHSAKFIHDPLNQISLVKNLFQLLVSFSSHNALKNVAVLAPVIRELYRLIRNGNCCAKEVEELLDGISGYISLLSATDFEEVGEFNLCATDSIRVWIVEEIGENCEIGDCLRSFCPLLNDGVRKSIGRDFGGRLGLGILAGVVMVEVFLLRLYIKFVAPTVKGEVEKDSCDWAVCTISSFRNYSFLDILLRMLLEPVCPVISLQNAEDELVLKEVLFDAVMMVDFSFICPPKVVHASDRQLKNISVEWLLVADKAIQSIRQHTDQTKVNSYVQAFAESCLPSMLINWVMNRQNILGEMSLPDVSSPISLIRWLLVSEDRGIKVFDSDFLKMCAKSSVAKADRENEDCVIQSGNRKLRQNCLDRTGEEEDNIWGLLEMVDSVDTVSPFASGLISATHGARKRKEDRHDDNKQTKFVKCHFTKNTLPENLLRGGDGASLNNGCKVSNFIPGEDAVFMDI